MFIIHSLTDDAGAKNQAPGTATISLIRMPHGGGNVGGGMYLYSCTPKSVPVSPTTTMTVTFNLDSATAGEKFGLYGLTSTSPRKVEVPIRSNGQSITAVVTPDLGELIIFAIVVRDLTNNELIYCDPQVDNSPKTGT